ncbi:MAG: hypothetical protein NHB15_05895 [Methanosarcina barkeri]|nr:hypothetical protein [Methanosarcina sp. ERenArc_MAG2]
MKTINIRNWSLYYTIRNLEINSNGDGNGAKPHGKGYYNCIHCINCDSISVYNCVFYDSLVNGLRVKTFTNIKFYNNAVYKIGYEGFYGINSQKIELIITE